jgi:hypothetical protein
LAGGFKRDVGCLFFGYLLLATQKKVTRPPGGTGYVNKIREANAYEISRTAVRVREDDKLIGGARRCCSLVPGDFRVFRVPSGLGGRIQAGRGCLFFGYFRLATQTKVTRSPGGTGNEN